MITKLIGTLGSALFAAMAYGQCEIDQLTAPLGGRGDDFGRSVAVWSDTLVVGSPTTEAPAAYVFRSRGGTWALDGVLRPPLPTDGSQFGWAVAAAKDLVLVGAPTWGADFRGTAFLYRRNESGWHLMTQITASDARPFSLFGYAVAIEGHLAAIGARDDDHNGISQSGSAYIFRFDGTSWKEEAKLVDPAGGGSGDLFGVDVAVARDRVLIGAHGKNHTGNNNGSAFVFCHSKVGWFLEAELTAFDFEADQRFGQSVALSDTVALVGAPLDRTVGAAYIFRRDGSIWSREQRVVGSNIVGQGWFGRAVSISPDEGMILIGAPIDTEVTGAAWLFRDESVAFATTPAGTAWLEVEKLTAVGDGSFSNLGTAASLSQDQAFVGAPGRDGVPGRVHVFNLDGCKRAGDLDGDGSVDEADLAALMARWGTTSPKLDGHKPVDLSDLVTLLANWSLP